MSDLYYRYCSDRTHESINDLFEGLIGYDFSNYQKDMEDMLMMRAEARQTSVGMVRLYSNGSTGGERSYEFSPHFHQWASKLEPFLRNMNDGKTIFLYSRPGNGKPPGKLYVSETQSTKKHYETNANFLEEQQILDLFKFVDGLHEQYGKVNFSSFPDIWNMLFSNPLFTKMCAERKHKIGCFVNSDFEMLFGTDEFWVRDQMINWRSGLNFFTCRYGKKHFLPMFVEDEGCTSLINMTGAKDDSDRVSLSREVVACECGRPRLPMEILFHGYNSILGPDGRPLDFSPLKRSLRGRYATIQFHQNHKNEIVVFMTPLDWAEDDKDAIKCFFSGLKTEFRLNRYFEVGSKRYCFWRSESVEEKEFRTS